MFPAVLFIAVGFVTALSVGFRLVHAMSLGRRNVPAGRLRSMPVHLLVVVLLAVAFVADHRSAVGWVALLSALFVELVRWGVGGASTSVASDGVTGTPGDQSSPAEEPGRPIESRRRTRSH